jgi:hypothetical protein
MQSRGGGGMSEQTSIRGFRSVFSWSLAFFLVYVAIHIFLNLTQQGFGTPSWHGDYKRLIAEISGPVTISICSSLLIFSYGMFLLHGLKDLSISAPNAFLNAFIIFISGQIVVQFTGHLEIYVSNVADDTGGQVSWFLALLSALCYPAAFMSLALLENYSSRVFHALKDQIPEDQIVHGETAGNMRDLTIVSVILLAAKFAVIAWDYQSKFGVVVVVLVLEFLIAIVVVTRARGRTHKQQSFIAGSGA